MYAEFDSRKVVERTKLISKILLPFYNFRNNYNNKILITKMLITKNHRILVFNFFLKYYQFYRKTAREINCLFSFYFLIEV